MITQLVRVRNAFVSYDHPRAYGYLIGRETIDNQSHATVFAKYADMIIAWTDGTVENDEQHKRNVAWQGPTVYLSNE